MCRSEQMELLIQVYPDVTAKRLNSFLTVLFDLLERGYIFFQDKKITEMKREIKINFICLLTLYLTLFITCLSFSHWVN